MRLYCVIVCHFCFMFSPYLNEFSCLSIHIWIGMQWGSKAQLCLIWNRLTLDPKEKKTWTESIWSWYSMCLCDHAHQQTICYELNSRTFVQAVQGVCPLTICYHYVEMRLSGSFYRLGLVRVDSTDVDWVDSGSTVLAQVKSNWRLLKVEYGCGCKLTKQCEAMFYLRIWLNRIWLCW
jgi:hypothetical protein